MKKAIILSLFVVFATATFCQQTTQKHSLTKTDYLQKSKKQKKVGLILIATGAVLFTVSVVVPKGELTDELSYPCLCKDNYKNDDIKAALGLAGVVTALGSIPFFIASGKNKRRANNASAFFRLQKIPVYQNAVFNSRSVPAIGIKIGL
jgi:hypothetical protein